MRAISIVCVGKLKESYLSSACQEYAKRLKGYCKLSIIEVDEYKLPDKLSKAQIDAALINEGRALLAKALPNSVKVALCIEGKMMASEGLADYIENSAVSGKGDFTFFIGGSWGLSDEVKSASDLRLSMSPMTFPHQLARVMLLEQLYRSFQIISGGKYHK
ncbi:MAG TPA: 23S rRNA (pseudouridine(1915)-N(3))-methyltransferase RlmH [Candidatus Avimonas sp.]|nr:23S rRNA (pseudouridine(1915)-N(3))-methyltransferase RlmH [Clostridiales bacterium]HPU58168.1 23S rRNA (pseudouridine(1915)-N(3))-methyltransferase RlmH [Candidatus Avimonas sp.]